MERTTYYARFTTELVQNLTGFLYGHNKVGFNDARTAADRLLLKLAELWIHRGGPDDSETSLIEFTCQDGHMIELGVNPSGPFSTRFYFTA